MEYNLVIDTLKQLDSFQRLKTGSDQCLEDFRCYLNEQANEKEIGQKITSSNDRDIAEIENLIAEQVLMLGRYSKHLLKKSLEHHPDLVNEDFTYLFHMMGQDSLTKMQLIEKNAHEKQSGIEIIKRLVRNGLLQEKKDEEDKRSTRISLTEKGRQVCTESIKDISVASKILCGKLGEEEKNTLLLSLEKLNSFHQYVYKNLKNEEPESILKMVGNE